MASTTSWVQRISCGCTVYFLNETNNMWEDKGTNGTILMFQNTETSDVRLRWTKNTDNTQEIWWRLVGSKLKPKNQRAVVLRACETKSNKQEIVALRFKTQDAAIAFTIKYGEIYPIWSKQQI